MESLGWLTESTVMPKKHKAIEGVGAASILDLKAQLYRTQEEARNSTAADAASSEFRRAKKRSGPADPLGTKNSGVDARAHKDKLELKAVKDGSACYSALEKKAELYEKLSRGELPDEEDQEKYCVDFFQKSYHQVSERWQPEIPTASEHVEPENDNVDSVPNPKPMGLGRTGTIIDQDEHKRFVRYLFSSGTCCIDSSEFMCLSLRSKSKSVALEQMHNKIGTGGPNTCNHFTHA